MDVDSEEKVLSEEYSTCKTCSIELPKTSLLRHINNNEICKADYTIEDLQTVRALSHDFQRRKKNQRERANYDKEKRAKKHKANYNPEKRAQTHRERYAYYSEKIKSRYDPQKHVKSYDPEQRREKYE